MQESNVRFLPCNWTWNLGNFGKVMSALSWYGSMMFVPLSYAIWVIFIFTWFCCTLLLCKSRFRDVVLDVCPSLHGWSIPVSQYIVTLQNQTSIKWLIYISISARLFFFFFFFRVLVIDMLMMKPFAMRGAQAQLQAQVLAMKGAQAQAFYLSVKTQKRASFSNY